MHDDDSFDDWDEDEISVRVWSSGGYGGYLSEALMDFTRAVVWGVGFALGFSLLLTLALVIRAAMIFLV